MKFIQLSLLFVLLCTGCTSSNSDKKSSTNTESKDLKPSEENLEVEDFFMKDLNGKSYTMEDLKGKRLFINFWATWCKPCIAEMPDIEKLRTILENENYVFFLVSDQSFEKIQAFQEKRKFDLNFAQYNGTLQDIGIQSLPTTFIYNSKGEKVKEIIGAVNWSEESIINNLREIE